MSHAIVVPVERAFVDLAVGQSVELVYPSSRGGDEARSGRIEKLTPPLVVVETAKGFRSFNIAKIVGGEIKVVG